jgi:hypothetical protein
MNGRFLAALLVAVPLALPGALHAQNKDNKAADGKPEPPDPKVLQNIVDAFAGGLPQKWDRAWVVVAQVADKGGARDFEVQCLYQGPGDDPIGKPIAGCDRKAVFENVYSLNRNIPAREQRRWKSATVVFMPDGKFEVKYDYGEPPQPTAGKQGKKTN